MPTCRAICESALRKIGVLAAGRAARANDANDALSSLQGLYMGWIDSGAFGRLRDVIPVNDYIARENERIFRNQNTVGSITLPETVNRFRQWWDFDRQVIGYTKTPIENLFLSYDFSSRLNGATIVSIQRITASPTDLVQGPASIVGNTVQVQWGGGSLGLLYQTAVVITDSAGETLEVDGPIQIKDPQAYGARNSQTTPRDCSVVVINDAFTASTTTFLYDGGVKLWCALDGLTLDSNAPLSARNPDGIASALAVQMVDEFGGDLPASTARGAANFQSGLLGRFSMERVEAVGVYM